MSKQSIVRLAGIFISLFFAVVFVGEVLGQPMLIAIGMVVPPYALVWSLSLAPPGQRKSTAAGQFAKEELEKLIELRNPALLIVSANIFGISIAEVIPAQTVAALVDTYAIAPDAVIVSLALLFLLCGPVGVHPLILIVLIGHLAPLGIFALPDQLTVLVLLAMWGIMTAVSPITNTTLFMAYFAQVSPWTVAVKWNGFYGVTAAVVVCLLAIIVRNMGLFFS